MARFKKFLVEHRRDIVVMVLALLGVVAYQVSTSSRGIVLPDVRVPRDALHIDVPSAYLAYSSDEVEVVYFVLPTNTPAEQDRAVMLGVVDKIHAMGKVAIVVVCPGEIEQSQGHLLYECTGLAVFPLP